MHNGKLLIDQEIESRGLTIERIETLYHKVVNSYHESGCNRCGSGHLIEIEVGSVQAQGGSNILNVVALLRGRKSIKGSRIECQICGYLIKDDSM
ncbi:MAG: hypothetical protein EA358_00155 [Flavobacteriales bacterium]|nr:MAG: hypothetical protein EA358_00155 [Flavobacteriales bacterium]